MFPDGYAANLRRGASPEKLKIFGLKSHDWHIWLERGMPVMLRGYIPEEEWLVLAELSYLFRVLCAKELFDGVLEDMEDMEDMEGETSGSRGRGRGHALPPL